VFFSIAAQRCSGEVQASASTPAALKHAALRISKSAELHFEKKCPSLLLRLLIILPYGWLHILGKT
jgi:hypothetical protein